VGDLMVLGPGGHSILERELSRPPLEDVLQEIARAAPVRVGRPVAELLREEREHR
jgi:hypothetical protein